MPLDPQRIREVREWLTHALRDLDSAGVLLASRPAYPDNAVFHCQQAVEKTWKGFLSWHGIAFSKTHDLHKLGFRCASVDRSLTELAGRAEDLTPFAWIFRYPGEPDIPSIEEAEQALAIAREVHGAVLARLPPETRP